MAIVELKTKEKIGRIYKLCTSIYEIPDNILCSKDNSIMNYSSYHQAYICNCKNCKEWISGIEFVKNELKNQISESEIENNNL